MFTGIWLSFSISNLQQSTFFSKKEDANASPCPWRNVFHHYKNTRVTSITTSTSLSFLIACQSRRLCFRMSQKKMTGPLKVSRVDNKEICVTDGIKTKQFNKTQNLPDPQYNKSHELLAIFKSPGISSSVSVRDIVLTEILYPADASTKSVLLTMRSKQDWKGQLIERYLKSSAMKKSRYMQIL